MAQNEIVEGKHTITNRILSMAVLKCMKMAIGTRYYTLSR